jgi:predicted DNA-binding protein (MmcQ/YjbR family)
MNKTYWNTIMIDGTVPDKLIKEWIDHSYDQVVKALPKNKQQTVNSEL